jgi:transposase-like protein
LRETDGGKSIVEVSKEHNISEVTFHRWCLQLSDTGTCNWNR